MIKIPNLRSAVKEFFKQNESSEVIEEVRKPSYLKSIGYGRKKAKEKVEVGELVRVTPGGRHGWYESNVGLIRKPLKDYSITA